MLLKLEKFSIIVNKIVSTITAILLIIMLTIVCVGIVFRYFLRNPIPWVVPISTMILIWIGLLGITVAFKSRDHVAVKSLLYLFPENIQIIIFYVNYILVLILLLVIGIGGVPVATGSRQLIMISARIQVPAYYTVSAVPIFAFINIIHVLPLPNLVKEEIKERDKGVIEELIEKY